MKTTNPLIADVCKTFGDLDPHGVRHKLSSVGFSLGAPLAEPHPRLRSPRRVLDHVVQRAVAERFGRRPCRIRQGRQGRRPRRAAHAIPEVRASGDGPSLLAHGRYSSINLLTDTDQRKWLVGFRQDDDHSDFADLYRFSIFDSPPPPTMSPVADGTRHFYYDAGACRLVGFRYGAGLSVDEANQDFAFYATDRNPRFRHINYNRFDPPTSL